MLGQIRTTPILFLLISTLSALQSVKAQLVIFADDNLKEVILEVIGTENNFATAEEMETLGTLTIRNREIEDLKGLESATNLTNLDLANNDISSLDELSALTELTSLNLAGNQISSIAPLANLTKLSNLDLSTNKIESIGDLSQDTAPFRQSNYGNSRGSSTTQSKRTFSFEKRDQLNRRNRRPYQSHCAHPRQ